MIFFVSIYRTIKFSVQNFFRNIWLSIVTVIILVLTLIFISILSGMNLLADRSIQIVKDKVDITVFFITDAKEEDIMKAREYVTAMPEVKSLEYISQTEALVAFKEEHTNDPKIIASLVELENNPLPASIIIKAHDLTQYRTIIEKLGQSDFTDIILKEDFQDSEVIISRISDMSQRTTQVGIGVSVLFVIISFLVAFNTMRIAIYVHKEEVAIMKLVGATNWFVRGPFILEGLLYAFIASVITMSILYPLAIVISPYIDSFFAGYSFDFLAFFLTNFWKIFGLQLVVSLVLNVLSSMVAITRYLKV